MFYSIIWLLFPNFCLFTSLETQRRKDAKDAKIYSLFTILLIPFFIHLFMQNIFQSIILNSVMHNYPLIILCALSTFAVYFYYSYVCFFETQKQKGRNYYFISSITIL